MALDLRLLSFKANHLFSLFFILRSGTLNLPEMSTQGEDVSERIELNTEELDLVVLVLVVDCDEEGGVNIRYRQQKNLDYEEFE